MKGNQESMLYTTNATVAALNHVSGFDPLKFLRRTTSRKTGEDVMRLDLRYKKLWFRLACPTGRLKLNALRITEKMAIFEAKVYRDREDAEPLSSYVANCTLDATPGGLYVEAAQEEALDTALSNAGFGIQFADVGSESEEYGSEVSVGAKPEISKLVQTKAEVAEPVQKQPEPVKATLQESAKAEWEAKQAHKKLREQQELDRLAAMSDDDVMQASMNRVSQDTERLTRRNMKLCVMEDVQTECLADPAFARLVMNPKKKMLNCFHYINRKAREYLEQEMKDNDEKSMGGGFGGDVPDELCYQWAREYFRDADAKEDAESEEKFVPKTYNGKTPKAGKKEKSKKTEPKPAVTIAQRTGVEEIVQDFLPIQAAMKPMIPGRFTFHR